jgi:hypothetical protein
MGHLAVRRTFIAAVSIVLGCSAAGSAYPIAPRTLWDLAQEAELVVLAYVDSVTRGATSVDDFDSSVAHLRVLESWKGGRHAAVDVSFTEGLICPAPARYVEGEIVLAFLESGEARARGIEKKSERRRWAENWAGRWFTVALSYGTLYPEPDEVPVFRRLLTEAVELQARASVPERDRRRWLLRAAVEPATRWHGLYDLSRESDPMHAFYDRRPAQRGLALAADERATLAAAFAKAPVADGTVPMMLKVLSGHPDREVDLTGLAAVDTALAADQVPYWVHEAMPLVLARFGEMPPRPAKCAKKDKRDCELLDDPLLRAMERTDVQARRDWAEARQRLGLPAVDPLPLSRRRVRGVGAATPP